MRKDLIQYIVDTQPLNWESKSALEMLIFDLYTIKQCIECDNSKEYLERCVVQTLKRLDVEIGFPKQKAV